jgi:hypothetical protein
MYQTINQSVNQSKKLKNVQTKANKLRKKQPKKKNREEISRKG